MRFTAMWYTRMVLSFIESAFWDFFYVGDKMFERVEKLIGIENLNKIKNQVVAVIGLGGVGG